MRKILLFLLFLSLSFNLNAEMIKPDPSIGPKDVISIQLKALKVNNIPYEDAGIEQTWEFAHPNNRIYTGPLNNFIRMMKNPVSIIILTGNTLKLMKSSERLYRNLQML